VPNKPASNANASAPTDYGSYIFSVGLMNEAGDLDPDARKRVLYTHDHLETWNHYDVLGLERGAEEKEVKKGYFERSKEFHPDRFRRFQDLGSFKKRIDEIYRRVGEAYRVLTDPDQRPEYDKSLPAEPNLAGIEDILREQVQAERDERRAEERERRRIEQNPVLARFKRAKAFFEEAKQLEAAGKVAEAMRAAQMATTYDERKPEYAELFQRLRDAAGDERIVPYLKRGRHKESMTEWEEAIEMYQEAVRIAPGNPEARVRLAYTLLAGGRGPDEVMPHAQRAIGMAPEDPESHYVLARCYEEAGNEKSAKRHYQRALELRPNYVEAKKRLSRLRWGF
jgi:curved DNA-binding protein CbpA